MRSTILRVSIFCLVLAIVLSLSTSKLHEKKHHKSTHKTLDKLKPTHMKKLSAEEDFDFEMNTDSTSTSTKVASASSAGISDAINLIKNAESEIGELASKMTRLNEELESAKRDLEQAQEQQEPVAEKVTEKVAEKETKKEDEVVASIPKAAENEESAPAADVSTNNVETQSEGEAQNEVQNEEANLESKTETEKSETEKVETEKSEPASLEATNENASTETASTETAASESTASESTAAGMSVAEPSNPSSEQDEEVSLLQISLPDEMNSVDDDDSSAPVLMAMKKHQTILAQNAIQRKTGAALDDSGFTFGARTDGSGKTFDITEDGRIIYPPPPTEEDEFLKAVSKKGADAKERVDKPMNSTEALDDANVVCVCKRHGAPRGFDRVRCKRNPTPTPTPVPVQKAPVGIKQCANGTWTAGSEKGVSDVICIYFPADEVKVIAPPTPAPEPIYPAECYDERNEWVAEGVEQKVRDKVDVQLLIQQGYESCGC